MSIGHIETARLVAAVATLGGYAALCVAVALVQRRKALAAAARTRSLAGTGDARPLLVAHASQTGAAEQIAWQTAQALHGAARPVRVAPLGTLALDDLRAASSVLIVASTCGEGDAPDGAAPFVRRLVERADGGSLADVRYGLLALGDRGFANFCAFGRRLDAWMLDGGARPLFARIDVDGLRDADLARWKHELGRLANAGDALAWREPERQPWRLVRRTHANPGSSGAPVFHLELEPPAGTAATWEAGDLLQVRVPDDPDRPRLYSIASTPAEGRAHLLVRQERRPDGRLGLASGWLTRDAEVGSPVMLGTVAHANFRLGDNAGRPLILIGNGTGIAGLRAHLSAQASRARACEPTRNWLVFGERQAAHDFHFRSDVERWHAEGTIARLDLAFSRDQARKHYVQDRLRAQPEAVRQWLDAGAAVYVCGSLQGMARGVDEALTGIVGAARVEALIAEGRYRRDVY